MRVSTPATAINMTLSGPTSPLSGVAAVALVDRAKVYWANATFCMMYAEWNVSVCTRVHVVLVASPPLLLLLLLVLVGLEDAVDCLVHTSTGPAAVAATMTSMPSYCATSIDVTSEPFSTASVAVQEYAILGLPCARDIGNSAASVAVIATPASSGIADCAATGSGWKRAVESTCHTLIVPSELPDMSSEIG